ncbi:spermatogenesis-associated protein 7 isoform 1 [Homo sapiens]|uniref:Spermatogenesis-associated protein 7 n=3 Tax=Homo sapiens TaxID=9606 RepID=SPAT7_HUMAN|nr:spermatogenesis-associated protein 7 isoform 1 [Homo sapiens]Q9P0W8.3 RecName: Full=Spermatogenesis-associated protein 7; AltName: Full=HSD-3.1; AltName: Full=Spermatogenesis-associated protein HSD3 [Homo sapiens]ACF94506.1 epididymis secretory protein Li 296 [Homo sapiens]EAW81381.1 spermatogenesis associated 7, isoform CRA_f [Homo sapiens]CAD18999.1 dJ1175B15.1 (similar to rat fertility related protein WMP1) [Homo sapiens]|eukprot:NP_060888.2 spermatogenesis-associated protein 7 isoform 1 [Homo sapiens]
MDGSRRVRATSVLPRYGPPCLFKGHLSTKSNAFCTDSSSLRLSTLQLVKNHMAVHYNKILSAKAAVDCSVPVSVSTSIKYADQQRREKLKKELAQCEKEFKLTKTAMRANYKNNSKSLFNTLQKPSGEPQIEDDMLKEEMNGFSSFARSLVPSSERLHLSLHKSSKVITNGPEKNSSSSPSSVDYAASGPRKLSSGALYGRRPRSTFPNSHRFQLVISKAPSGDLLDKHSELFSNKQLPFTPRTLKTEAKSFLSQYRYYTPAKRKKDFTDQRIEAETQTELSFKSELGTAETKNMTDSEMNIKQASNCVTYDAKEKIAPLPLEGHDSTWDEIKDDALQHSSPRAMCQYSLKPPSTRKIYSDEEELLYLSFIEDVTDEILKLGLFSNRFLERLFERHIKQNKHLEEEKMRHLLHVLKVDLGCTSEENSVKQNDVDMLNVFDFEKAGNSEPNELKNESEVTIQQERQQYQKALDMLLSAPKDENEIFPSPTEFFMPIYKSKHSEGVIIQQVNDETNLETSTLDENHPSISDSLTDRETSVNVIEGDSDPEKVEISNGLCGLNTSPSQSVQFSSVKGDNNHDMELSTLKIMEMSIEDCPLDV